MDLKSNIKLYQHDVDRFLLVKEREGIDAALIYAERSYKVYRSAVLKSRKRGFTKPHHGSLPEYRKGFIESYLTFRFIYNTVRSLHG